jgi:hypothetical protein
MINLVRFMASDGRAVFVNVDYVVAISPYPSSAGEPWTSITLSTEIAFNPTKTIVVKGSAEKIANTLTLSQWRDA